jgi:hypothetical protein
MQHLLTILQNNASRIQKNLLETARRLISRNLFFVISILVKISSSFCNFSDLAGPPVSEINCRQNMHINMHPFTHALEFWTTYTCHVIYLWFYSKYLPQIIDVIERSFEIWTQTLEISVDYHLSQIPKDFVPCKNLEVARSKERCWWLASRHSLLDVVGESCPKKSQKNFIISDATPRVIFTTKTFEKRPTTSKLSLCNTQFQ